MARISEDQRLERSDAILDAATRSFAGEGFHVTSMAEVIAASGLAAGTVYKYFANKDELIVACAERALDTLQATLVGQISLDAPPTLEAFLHTITMALPKGTSGQTGAYLVLHSWAETGRNEELATLVQDRYARMLDLATPLCMTWQRRGDLPAFLTEEAAPRFLLALVLGHIVQLAVTGTGMLTTE